MMIQILAGVLIEFIYFFFLFFSFLSFFFFFFMFLFFLSFIFLYRFLQLSFDSLRILFVQRDRLHIITTILKELSPSPLLGQRKEHMCNHTKEGQHHCKPRFWQEFDDDKNFFFNVLLFLLSKSDFFTFFLFFIFSFYLKHERRIQMRSYA